MPNSRTRSILDALARFVKSVTRKGLLELARNPEHCLKFWSQLAATANEFPNTDIKLRLPEVPLSEILSGATSIPIVLLDYVPSPEVMPLHDLIPICQIASYQNASVIFEIGTYEGQTTLELAANTKGDVYTLDLPPNQVTSHLVHNDPDRGLEDIHPDQPGIRFEGKPFASRIHQILGNSFSYDFSPYYERVNLIFVDGCHHRECVERDSENALKMAAAGGVVLWHDYAPYAPGVVETLNALGRSLKIFHVKGTALAVHLKESGVFRRATAEQKKIAQ